MFEIHNDLPVCHNLDGGKARTRDVLLEENIPFSSLLLKEEIQNGLARCGYTHLSPIQKNALPVALTGTSIIAHAKSGTGKTLVYVLSALNRILERNQRDLQCLILSPTREIAKQIYDVFKSVGYYIKDLKIEYFIGGTPLDFDVLKCKECQVAIGAPGRIKHLIDLGELKTASIQMLVLDEVDALLSNKEFAIQELVAHLPVDKQTIVCTATFPDYIKQLLNPISTTIQYITVRENTENEGNDQITSNILIGIKQYVAPVFCDSTTLDTIRKRNKLIEILRHFRYDQCFVFVNYVTIAKGLCNMLISNDFPALWVSSEQDQSTRISTLNKLKLNQCNIMVTTDLAARGIDVHNVNLVINMGIPSPPDVYIHRMGRAGRYGSEGAVITILHEGAEIEQFYKLISTVCTDPVDLYMLPNEIDKNVNEIELQVIKCQPDLNAAANANEYYFKKNNENQANKNVNKKKSKKSKKKKKTKKTNVKGEDATNLNKEESSTDEMAEKDDDQDDVTVSKEMEKLVKEYIEGIKEAVNNERVEIDRNNLRQFFKPSESTFRAIQISNYFKPTFMDVRQRDEDDDDVFESPNETESLIQYANFVKKKHAFLDEQKIPCSIYQFLELIKRNESLISDHISANIYDSVKGILEVIRLLLKHEREKRKKDNEKCNLSFNNVEKRTVKRINEHLKSDEPRSLDTVNSIEHEVGNWMISRSDLSAYYSPKRSKNRDLTPPLKNFTSNPPFSKADLPYTVFKSSRVVQPCSDMEQDESFSASDTGRVPPSQPSGGMECNSRSNSSVTCPNCRHSFTLPEVSNVPLLQPINTYVNSETERKIWQNHFNFISNRVRSPTFIFGNR